MKRIEDWKKRAYLSVDFESKIFEVRWKLKCERRFEGRLCENVREAKEKLILK